MKKIIIAFSVFVFVFALAGDSLNAMTGETGTYAVSFTADKDPKADGTRKAANADKNAATTTSSGSSKSASSGDCSKSCDKSAKASGDCGSKKTTTAEATPAPANK